MTQTAHRWAVIIVPIGIGPAGSEVHGLYDSIAAATEVLESPEVGDLECEDAYVDHELLWCMERDGVPADDERYVAVNAAALLLRAHEATALDLRGKGFAPVRKFVEHHLGRL